MRIFLYRPWVYPENFGIYSQLDGKSEAWFYTFYVLCVCILNQRKKSLSHSFYVQNLGILQTRLDQRGDPIKINFGNFQMQKLVS